jgi:hypothetical protein
MQYQLISCWFSNQKILYFAAISLLHNSKFKKLNVISWPVAPEQRDDTRTYIKWLLLAEDRHSLPDHQCPLRAETV